jgi:hypothetical protein
MTGKNRTILAAGAAVVAGVCLLASWRPSAKGPQLESDLQRAERLEAERQRVLQRCRGQMAVAAEVVAGRLTLLQAAARVRALRADEPPLVWKMVQRGHPGLSREEWLCRVVINYVGRVLYDDPAQARALVRRLRAELREHRQRGPLRLPSAERDE